MSNRLATRIGLPSAEERPADAFDVGRFHEPAVGALARTKGSLFLLAQLTGGSASARDRPRARRSTRSGATTTTTCRPACSCRSPRRWPAPTGASTTSAARLGHPAPLRRERGGGRHPQPRGARRQARRRPARSIVRDGRMYEVPPPPAVTEEDPRVRRRRVAATLGEALEVEPYTWHGRARARRSDRAGEPPLRPHRRRRRARSARRPRCGRPRRSSTSSTSSPSAAASGSDGILAIEVAGLADHRDHPPPRAGPAGRAVRRPARPEPGAAGRRDRPRPASRRRRGGGREVGRWAAAS